MEEPFYKRLLEHGVPVFPEPERAARALAALARCGEMRENLLNSGGKSEENGSELVGKIPL